MLEVKAGQWWTEKGHFGRQYIVVVLVVSRAGKVFYEFHDGVVATSNKEFFFKNKEYLPECTGWDWEPAVYPQYRESYMPNVWAFVRLDSPTQYTYVRLDGTDDPSQEHRPGWDHINERTKLTEAEALAKIVKPEPAKPKTRTVRVHTVAYGYYDKLKFVGNILDTELAGLKRDCKTVQVLKTEEYEVPCE